MNRQGLLFLCFLLVGMLSSFAIDFSRINIAWQYDLDAEIKLTHRVVQKYGNTHVFLQISADSLDLWDYQFLAQKGYETEEHRKIEVEFVDTLSMEPNRIMLELKVNQMEENLLVVKIVGFERFYYYDIGLRVGSLDYPTIYAVNDEGIPILDNYINKSGFQFQGNDTYYLMKYFDRFQPADPAMAEMKPLAPKADLDTGFVFRDSVLLVENNFYVIRADSNASSGVTFLRTPPYFPESRKLSELAESMLYITNETERKSLLNSKNLKSVFDSFWMNNFNTKSRARNAIRKYYTWVKNANILYTDFKPGWKTDRGMMYIIYGAPDEVYRTGNLEEWYYDSGDAFEFTIISSFFAPRTYALRRNKGLETSWFQRIAAIRRGINE